MAEDDGFIKRELHIVGAMVHWVKHCCVKLCCLGLFDAHATSKPIWRYSLNTVLTACRLAAVAIYLTIMRIGIVVPAFTVIVK